MQKGEYFMVIESRYRVTNLLLTHLLLLFCSPKKNFLQILRRAREPPPPVRRLLLRAPGRRQRPQLQPRAGTLLPRGQRNLDVRAGLARAVRAAREEALAHAHHHHHRQDHAVLEQEGKEPGQNGP